MRLVVAACASLAWACGGGDGGGGASSSCSTDVEPIRLPSLDAPASDAEIASLAAAVVDERKASIAADVAASIDEWAAEPDEDGDPTGHAAVGSSAMLLRDFPAAAYAFARAAAEQPDAANLVNLGFVLAETGDPERARRALLKAAASSSPGGAGDPVAAVAYVGLGWSYLEEEPADCRLAIVAFRRACEADSSHPDCYVGLCEAYADCGLDRLAAAACDQAGPRLQADDRDLAAARAKLPADAATSTSGAEVGYAEYLQTEACAQRVRSAFGDPGTFILGSRVVSNDGTFLTLDPPYAKHGAEGLDQVLSGLGTAPECDRVRNVGAIQRDLLDPTLTFQVPALLEPAAAPSLFLETFTGMNGSAFVKAHTSWQVETQYLDMCRIKAADEAAWTQLHDDLQAAKDMAYPAPCGQACDDICHAIYELEAFWRDSYLEDVIVRHDPRWWGNVQKWLGLYLTLYLTPPSDAGYSENVRSNLDNFTTAVLDGSPRVGGVSAGVLQSIAEEPERNLAVCLGQAWSGGDFLFQLLCDLSLKITPWLSLKVFQDGSIGLDVGSGAGLGLAVNPWKRKVSASIFIGVKGGPLGASARLKLEVDEMGEADLKLSGKAAVRFQAGEDVNCAVPVAKAQGTLYSSKKKR